MRPRILCVVGTRPEVIKMAPVIRALRSRGVDAPLLATAQHRGLLDQMLATFDLAPTWDLDLMKHGQTPGEMVARMLPALEGILREVRPAAILAQGDTTSVFCASLAAFYAKVPFGHVEAGLRTGDLSAPFPEEGMRRLCSVLARWHFAPTEGARTALLQEGHPPGSIHVVGNSVIDALLATANQPDLPWPTGIPRLKPGERGVLVTLHRRENFGAPLRGILQALRTFAGTHPQARFFFPVHPNPSVHQPAYELLAGTPNIHLCEPLGYRELVSVLRESFLVLTDSGGLQEEAPALGKPVLVFRNATERPEAVEAGGVLLVGQDPARFLEHAERLWTSPGLYQAMARPRFPFGKGDTSEQIAQILLDDFTAGKSQPAESGTALA